MPRRGEVPEHGQAFALELDSLVSLSRSRSYKLSFEATIALRVRGNIA